MPEPYFATVIADKVKLVGTDNVKLRQGDIVFVYDTYTSSNSERAELRYPVTTANGFSGNVLTKKLTPCTYDCKAKVVTDNAVLKLANGTEIPLRKDTPITVMREIWSRLSSEDAKGEVKVDLNGTVHEGLMAMKHYARV